jgi:CubicO group peptidase (beta-lactamase class C family)
MSAAPDEAALEKVRQAVQPVLNEMAAFHNTSLSWGYTSAAGSISLVAGVHNAWTGENLTTAHSIGGGSITKPWMSVAVLQAYEEGLLDLEDPISMHLDPILDCMNGTSVEALFGTDTAGATIKQLIGMESGLPDYPDDLITYLTLSNQPVSPIDYIYWTKKTSVCDNEACKMHRSHCTPGKCVSYSGIGIIFAGFIVMKARGFHRWEDFDLRQVIPQHLADQGRYNATQFFGAYNCSDAPRPVAHTYDTFWGPESDFKEITEDQYWAVDLYDTWGCTNGYTMGNIGSSGGDLAQFFYDLFVGEIQPRVDANGAAIDLTDACTFKRTGFLTKESLALMTDFKPPTHNRGWMEGAKVAYGLGLMNFPQSPADGLWQHGGADWGSGSLPVCGYYSKEGYSECIMFSSNPGNTSLNCERANVNNGVKLVEEETSFPYFHGKFSFPPFTSTGTELVGLKMYVACALFLWSVMILRTNDYAPTITPIHNTYTIRTLAPPSPPPPLPHPRTHTHTYLCSLPFLQCLRVLPRPQ